MSGSMSIACLLVMAGRAETHVAVVKARATVDEKRMFLMIESVQVDRLVCETFIDPKHLR